MPETSAIDKMLAHFQGLSNGFLHVPELGIDVHFAPMTLADETACYLDAAGKPVSVLARNARVVQRKARDAAGKLLFGPEDIKKLEYEVDAMLVRRIAHAIEGHGAGLGKPSAAPAAEGSES